MSVHDCYDAEERAAVDEARRDRARGILVHSQGMEPDDAEAVLEVYDMLGTLDHDGGQLQVAKRFWMVEDLLRQTVEKLGEAVKKLNSHSHIFGGF